MQNGVRNSIWALFFLAGMAFMATLIFMIRPDLFSANAAVREKPGSSVILGSDSRSAVEMQPPTMPQRLLPRVPPIQAEPVVLPQVQHAKAPNEPPPVNPAIPDQTPELQTVQPIVESAPAKLAQPEPRSFVTVRYVRPGRSVFGHVSLIGELPPPQKLPLSDRYCGPHSHATTIVSRAYLRSEDNSLADVVVFLRSDDLGKRHWIAPPQTAAIANRNCQFEPYVTAIQLGQSVEFENLDPILHNVHMSPDGPGNRPINAAMMPKSRPVTAEFKMGEMFIQVRCDVHPYMAAYICVIPHPFFALTRADGNFHIPNVPPGEYTVAAVHRKAGWREHEQKFSVSDSESPQVDFVLEAPTDVTNAYAQIATRAVSN